MSRASDPVGTTWGTPIGITIVLVCFALLILIFIPAYLGIRLGAAFATVLGILSMLPITVMIFLPFFHPSSLHWGNVSGFHAPPGVVVTFTFICAWLFPILWNVIAMEAAACYIGETRDPDRDAKIAMNAEGLYGLFIYTMIPISFIIVLGADKINSYVTEVGGLVDANQVFVTFANTLFGSSANWLDNLVAIMLITALSLSVLNAIMGSARGLHQMTIDGEFPRIFSKVNRHNVPGFAMGFNVICMIALVFTGGAVEIYTLSNVGYTVSFIPVLVAYYLLRQDRPEMRRPFKLPEFFKYIALFLAALYFIIWSYGGIVEASLPNAFLGNNDTKVYFVIGWVILLSYLPLYWYRKRVEDPKYERRVAEVAPLGSAGD